MVVKAMLSNLEECKVKINSTPWQKGLALKAMERDGHKEGVLFVDVSLSSSLLSLAETNFSGYFLFECKQVCGEIRISKGEKPKFFAKKIIGVEN